MMEKIDGASRGRPPFFSRLANYVRAEFVLPWIPGKVDLLRIHHSRMAKSGRRLAKDLLQRQDALSCQELQTDDAGISAMVHPTDCETRKLLPKIRASSFRYEYGYHYGSGEMDKREEKVLEVKGSGPYEIALGQLEAGRIYELAFDSNLISKTGEKMENPYVQYTLNSSQETNLRFSRHPPSLRKGHRGPHWRRIFRQVQFQRAFPAHSLAGARPVTPACSEITHCRRAPRARPGIIRITGRFSSDTRA